MSRIGKLPIEILENVSIVLDNSAIKVLGPKGILERKIHKDISIKVQDNYVHIAPLVKSALGLSMWGTTRSIVNNMVHGVKNGFKIELEIVGVGYKVSLKDNIINLAVGKSHSVKLIIPEGITVTIPKVNNIAIEGVDKEKVGQFVATIIKQRPTEPFKGKGIKFKDQFIKKKEGKKN
jgi:large subunit ribosomal protein L6